MEKTNIEAFTEKNLCLRLSAETQEVAHVHFDLQTPITVGRSTDCDIQVKDPAASRVHCRLVPDKNHVWLYDAGSRWGTFVNGKRVFSCELNSGDEIKIGNCALKFNWSGYFGLQPVSR